MDLGFFEFVDFGHVEIGEVVEGEIDFAERLAIFLEEDCFDLEMGDVIVDFFFHELLESHRSYIFLSE